MTEYLYHECTQSFRFYFDYLSVAIALYSAFTLYIEEDRRESGASFMNIDRPA